MRVGQFKSWWIFLVSLSNFVFSILQCRAYEAAAVSRSTDAFLSSEVQLSIFTLIIFSFQISDQLSFCQLDGCSAYLNPKSEPEWSDEEKKLPLAFAILDHRFCQSWSQFSKRWTLLRTISEPLFQNISQGRGPVGKTGESHLSAVELILYPG